MATDPTLATLAELDDPTKFVRLDAVPVLAPFERTQPDGSVVRVTAADLPAICERMKTRDAAGNAVTLTHGHIRPAAPETEQPPLLGLLRNPRLGRLQNGTPAIVMDRFVFTEHAATARKLPHRSSEYYPVSGIVRGVAALVRPPEIDMGVICLAGKPQFLCLSLGDEPMSTPATEPLVELKRVEGVPTLSPAELERMNTTLGEMLTHLNGLHAKVSAYLVSINFAPEKEKPAQLQAAERPALPGTLTRDELMVALKLSEGGAITFAAAREQVLGRRGKPAAGPVVSLQAGEPAAAAEPAGLTRDEMEEVQTIAAREKVPFALARERFLLRREKANGRMVALEATGGGAVPTELTKAGMEKVQMIARCEGISFEHAREKYLNRSY